MAQIHKLKPISIIDSGFSIHPAPLLGNHRVYSVKKVPFQNFRLVEIEDET